MTAAAEKLVRMANQISRFFTSSGETQAIADTADHIVKFWDPRMRAQLLAHVDAGGTGLDPVALQAAKDLAKRSLAKKPLPTTACN
ncbi:MAG: formate dehydrogenase subunit delta [Alphaproteobacteria bacterium]|nr:formate dehydrogenase subunit delta [Alphaproteobacteria bacterium]